MKSTPQKLVAAVPLTLAATERNGETQAVCVGHHHERGAA